MLKLDLKGGVQMKLKVMDVKGSAERPAWAAPAGPVARPTWASPPLPPGREPGPGGALITGRSGGLVPVSGLGPVERFGFEMMPRL